MGLKWQCVEFVRRYYYIALGKHIQDTGDAKTWHKPDVKDGEKGFGRTEYVVEDGTHPDEITQRCFRPLKESIGEVVMQAGRVQFRSPDENKSFTITCYQSVGSAPDRVLRELAIAVK